MDQQVHPTPGMDYRQTHEVWQRVAPGMEPYPNSGTPQWNAGGQLPTVPLPPAPVMPQPAPPAPSVPPTAPLPPGALQNPCCMGSEAAELLEVLEGFIEEELEDRRAFLALSRQAPLWARQGLRELAEDCAAHARTLCTAVYLITGQNYHPALVCSVEQPPLRWRAALRERYHSEACNGLNYARAADSTPDPCLSRLLQGLSRDEYRHADQLMAMLEKSL